MVDASQFQKYLLSELPYSYYPLFLLSAFNIFKPLEMNVLRLKATIMFLASNIINFSLLLSTKAGLLFSQSSYRFCV